MMDARGNSPRCTTASNTFRTSISSSRSLLPACVSVDDNGPNTHHMLTGVYACTCTMQAMQVAWANGTQHRGRTPFNCYALTCYT